MRYDANGNLIYDADRGISVIKYNILNLPDTIQFVNGNQIVNLYDAIGQKYKSIVYTNLSTTMTPYYSIAHYPLATEPFGAPNYNELPIDDNNKRPTHRNTTTKPMFTDEDY